jgi:polysaccharide deacetylase family protein (PEP-CTERM system associated)
MNILGIDFEDWYHPELIKPHVKELEKKPIMPKYINIILKWLKENNTFATFFVVGDLIKDDPSLLEKILADGHEIGFHTMSHTKLDTEGTEEKFEKEIKEFAKLTNNQCKGFRAPTFSLNEKSAWIIDVLTKNNYLYDSSIVPVKTSMYGIDNAPKHPYKISKNTIDSHNSDGKLIEFPILTGTFLGKKIPLGGGFYLRTLPMKTIKNAIKSNEEKNIPSTFYIHSWELLSDKMPKIKLSKKESFITYHNINKSKKKMTEIINQFKFTSFEKFLAKEKNNLFK